MVASADRTQLKIEGQRIMAEAQKGPFRVATANGSAVLVDQEAVPGATYFVHETILVGFAGTEISGLTAVGASVYLLTKKHGKPDVYVLDATAAIRGTDDRTLSYSIIPERIKVVA